MLATILPIWLCIGKPFPDFTLCNASDLFSDYLYHLCLILCILWYYYALCSLPYSMPYTIPYYIVHVITKGHITITFPWHLVDNSRLSMNPLLSYFIIIISFTNGSIYNIYRLLCGGLADQVCMCECGMYVREWRVCVSVACMCECGVYVWVWPACSRVACMCECDMYVWEWRVCVSVCARAIAA